MVTTAEKKEADVLTALRSRYERAGYTFIIHPPVEMIPHFLRGYQPDALALSERGSVVIEVKAGKSSTTESRLAQIAERVAKQPNWKFEVFYAGNFSRQIYDKPTKNEISRLLDEYHGLTKNGFVRAAFVMGWGALEAFARALRSNEGGVGPMIPSEVIEWLAQSGYIDSPTSRLLRSMIKTRNSIVHGVQDIEIQPHELLVLNSTLETLSHELAVIE